MCICVQMAARACVCRVVHGRMFLCIRGTLRASFEGIGEVSSTVYRAVRVDLCASSGTELIRTLKSLLSQLILLCLRGTCAVFVLREILYLYKFMNTSGE